MPNFLAGVGRSNLRAVGSNLVEQAVGIREQRTQNAANELEMTMRVEDFQKDQRIKDAEIEKLDEERRVNAFKIPIASIRHDLTSGGMPEEAVGFLETMARDNGMIQTGPHGEFISRGDSIQLNKMLAEDTTMKNSLVQRTLDGYQREEAQLQQSLTGEEALKGKEADAARERLALLRGSNGLIASAINALNDEIPAQAETPELVGTGMKPFPASQQVAVELGIKPGETYMTFVDDTGNALAGAAKMTVSQFATATEKGSGKGGITPEQAINKITAFQSAIARLESGQDIGIDLYADDPELQKFFATVPTENADLARQMFRQGIEHYSQFAPGFDIDLPPVPVQPDLPLVEGDVSQTGSVTVPIPPPGLPEGSEFIKYGPDGEEYWSNPADPTKAKKVIR